MDIDKMFQAFLGAPERVTKKRNALNKQRQMYEYPKTISVEEVEIDVFDDSTHATKPMNCKLYTTKVSKDKTIKKWRIDKGIDGYVTVKTEVVEMNKSGDPSMPNVMTIEEKSYPRSLPVKKATYHFKTPYERKIIKSHEFIYEGIHGHLSKEIEYVSGKGRTETFYSKFEPHTVRHTRVTVTDENTGNIHETRFKWTGDKISERFYDAEGLQHRDNGAAWIHYWPNNIKSLEVWYRHGKIHREDGPAQIYYDRNQNIEGVRYWFNNEVYESKDAYHTRLRLGIFEEPFNTTYKNYLRALGNTSHTQKEEPFTEEEIEEQLQAFREEIKDNEIQRLKDAQEKFPNQEFVEFRVI
jgi:hypothetical protein